MIETKPNQKTPLLALMLTFFLATGSPLVAISSPVISNNLILPEVSMLVTQVSPATVSIYASSSGYINSEGSEGSGFILEEDGYVLTCQHVIDGKSEITVRLNDYREYKAQLIGADKRADLALLKIEQNNLPVVKVSKSADQLKLGQDVFAIGSPYGLHGSVSKGVISGLNRNMLSEGYVPFIQMDTAINSGQSGGPLFNMKGEVVGINAMLISLLGHGFQGISFAIPIDYAMGIVYQLKKNGSVSHGWLGVIVEPVDGELAASDGLDPHSGILIDRVVPDSPGAKGGLQKGDIITSVDGYKIRSASDLKVIVGRKLEGNDVKIELTHQSGVQEVITLTVGKLLEPRYSQAWCESQCNTWWSLELCYTLGFLWAEQESI